MSDCNLLAFGKDIVYGGSGGSGGHTIEDSAGTDLDQRNTLQFAGTLQATDDSTNEKTIISDAAEEVEWSVWNAMTEAERDAYSAGKKIDIVNVPGADGTISADLITLLWTNPSPTAAFAAQYISLSDDDYDLLLVKCKVLVNDLSYIYLYAKKNESCYLKTNDIANLRLIQRGMSFNNATSVNFTAGQYRDTYNSSSNVTNDGRYMIPIEIYGIKKTINLKIDAIATDVSTSASKCMLSDGETSVENAITGLYIDSNNWTKVNQVISDSYTAPKTGIYSIFAVGTSAIPMIYLDSGKTTVIARGINSADGSTIMLPLKAGTTIYLRVATSISFTLIGYTS